MLVSNGTRVTLKNPVPAATEPSPTESVSSTSAKSDPENIEPETAGVTEDPNGCHWFDLNDSTVTAITVKDIEKQFQGKESAYMLFYRKTTMKRPLDGMLCICARVQTCQMAVFYKTHETGASAFSAWKVLMFNPVCACDYTRPFFVFILNSHRKPCVQSASSPGGVGTRGECKSSTEEVASYTFKHTHTEHVVFYAMFTSFVSCRAEFDASSNSIEVRLHLAPHYHCQNGALHPAAPNEDSIITVTFDRRKTVGDLRLAIYQVTSVIPLLILTP